MSEASVRVGEQRPGGRATRVRAAVLGAAAELLTEVGYDRFGIDEVAARAGVHKTTVYRRWPTKPELIADVVREQAAENIPIPDTGNLLDDLRQLAQDVANHVSIEGDARRTRTMIATAAASEELATAVHEFWAHRLALCTPIIERAIARGEVPDTANPNLVIEAVVGPIWLRLLVTGEPIDDKLTTGIAELITAGAQHHQTEPGRAGAQAVSGHDDG